MFRHEASFQGYLCYSFFDSMESLCLNARSIPEWVCPAMCPGRRPSVDQMELRLAAVEENDAPGREGQGLFHGQAEFLALAPLRDGRRDAHVGGEPAVGAGFHVASPGVLAR